LESIERNRFHAHQRLAEAVSWERLQDLVQVFPADFFRNPKLINLPRLGLSRAVSRELKPQKENGKNRIQTGHLNYFRPKKSLKYF